MGRVHNVKNGLVMGVLNNIINTLLPFVTRTIIIYKLGMDYVGLGGLFTSILNVLSLTELGFGAAISYTLYKPIAEQDTSKVNAILNLYRKVYRVMGSIIFVLGVIISPFLDKLVKGDHPADINLYVLFYIYIFNTVVSYLALAYKKILLSAHQRYDIEVGITMGVGLVQYGIQIILLLVFANYYLYIVIMPIMTVVGNLVSYRVASKKFPQYKCEGMIEHEEIVEIAKNVGGAFFSKIGATVYLSVDNIVISAFLGLGVLGVYGNYYYVISVLIAVFAVVHNTIRPVIGNYLVTESKEKNWELLKRINYMYMCAVVFCCSCCVVLYQSFEYLWGGEQNLLSSIIVVMLVVYFYTGRISAVLTIFQEAAGIWWYGKFVPLISALVNLGLNLYLVNKVGLIGVILSSIVSSMLVTFPGNIYIIFKYLFPEKKYKLEYLKFTILFTLKSLIIIVGTYFICFRMDGSTILKFILKAVICMGVNIVLILGLNINNSYMKEMLIELKRKLKSNEKLSRKKK